MILFYVLAVLLCLAVAREWSREAQIALTGMVFGWIIHLFDTVLSTVVKKRLGGRDG